MQLAHDGKTFGTRLSRCDLALEHAQALLEYEEKGIPTVQPAPSALVSEYQGFRDDLIMEEAQSIAEKSSAKSNVAGSVRSRETALANGLLKIQEITANLGDPERGIHLIETHQCLIHRTKLDGFLDAARKAEFKGNKKKAIDQYQEALYFIRNDDIPDEQQQKEIQEIESKLEELSS
ncbi:hypothetical protein MYX82_01440 [Acidobacteria bacterium AH-259-D05]|nr:hypothetical protein [Acidobacteria bacterium AH-259-D05]